MNIAQKDTQSDEQSWLEHLAFAEQHLDGTAEGIPISKAAAYAMRAQARVRLDQHGEALSDLEDARHEDPTYWRLGYYTSAVEGFAEVGSPAEAYALWELMLADSGQDMHVAWHFGSFLSATRNAEFRDLKRGEALLRLSIDQPHFSHGMALQYGDALSRIGKV